MLSSSMFLFALLIQTFYGYARPIGPNFTAMSHLERRMKPGSYSIMTPAQDMVIYDPRTKSFCIFVKFGDGDEAGRMSQYSTHNPSFDLHYRKSREKGLGGMMEGVTLGLLSETSIDVDNVKNHRNGATEWYRLNLGQDRTKAVAGKEALRKKMEAYKDHTDAKGYAAQFNQLVKEHSGNKPLKDGSTSPLTPKKDSTPSTPKKDNTPSTPKKDNTPSTPKKGSKTPKFPKKNRT